MKLRPAALEKIASYICGDPPLPFPYRSSSKLTAFFTGLDLDYIHRGETRNVWTREVLIEISRWKKPVGIYASPEDAIIAIIKAVVSPENFEEEEFDKLNEAISLMNRTLLPYELEIAFDASTQAIELRSTNGKFISTAHASPNKVTKITFSPRVFEVPEFTSVRPNLVAVMMPFAGFDGVHDAIKHACTAAGMEAIRADDIWDNSTILQDIFDLIYSAEIVISDFTGRNPNVMYETGVAHTLGKHVIPITQSIEHIPSNLHGHRALLYIGGNREGLQMLQAELLQRLKSITKGGVLANGILPR